MILAALFTDEELAAIGANGCGAKKGWFRPPDYCFGTACDHHDAAYWIGGDKDDRKDADLDFLEAMLKAAKVQVWYYRAHLEFAARRYYLAVRLFGGKYWHWGESRTRADLDAAVAAFQARGE